MWEKNLKKLFLRALDIGCLGIRYTDVKNETYCLFFFLDKGIGFNSLCLVLAFRDEIISTPNKLQHFPW